MVDRQAPVLPFVETRVEFTERNDLIAPLAAPADRPARPHRFKGAVAPVAPAPQARIGQKILGAAIQMQQHIALTRLAGARDGLQTPVNALFRHRHARERPADLFNIERINDSPARAQQRARQKMQRRREQRAAQHGGEAGVKRQRVLFRLAGDAQRHRALAQAQGARAEGHHRVALPGIPLRYHIHTSADARGIQPAAPVLHAKRGAAA